MTSVEPGRGARGPYGSLDDARATLLRCFGYADFRPPQIRAVEAVLSGRDALLVLPTGGGKSVCYQVPALVRHGLTIVVSPLISLMKDQVDALARRGIGAAYINSTLSADEVSARLAGAAAGEIRLLYLAPERLDGPRMLERLRHIGVALLAVDEAHCISEWGHDFRPSYRRLGTIRQQLGGPQAVALTATATPSVRGDIARQLDLVDPQIVVGGFDRTNLVYHVVSTPTVQDKDRAAVRWIRGAGGTTVVYAPTRKAVERVAAMLNRARVHAVAYHAGLDARERQRAQDAFMTERARVIVATSAFGMGIDKPNVRLVVHHAMSGSLEAYYQEAGRAGRDGDVSDCVLLHAPDDRFTHEFFIDNAHPTREVVERTWQALRDAADESAFVRWSFGELAATLPPAIGERRVAAAVRALAAAGALTMRSPSAERVHVRLLATPRRIRNELHGRRAVERQLLRLLWRAHGDALESGTIVDLGRLQPGRRAARAFVPVLERLATAQFVMTSPCDVGVQLDARSRHSEWLPVDWHALQQRRQHEMARLDAMQQFALTRACRRAFVLRYFGDPDARPHCGACDICHGTAAASSLPTSASSRTSRRRPVRRRF